jgi:hypothetical protein
MTNVGGLVTPERILSDIRRMIADPLKGASNEDKVHVTWHELRVQGGSLNEFFIDVIGQGVQLSVFELERPSKLVVSICKSPNAITKDRYG